MAMIRAAMTPGAPCVITASNGPNPRPGALPGNQRSVTSTMTWVSGWARRISEEASTAGGQELGAQQDDVEVEAPELLLHLPNRGGDNHLHPLAAERAREDTPEVIVINHKQDADFTLFILRGGYGFQGHPPPSTCSNCNQSSRRTRTKSRRL